MIIVIIGPTGVGKTKLSLELAKYYSTEIISGDSVQVYKGLDIGSAKITPKEMQNIKHHMINILEPTEPFSVAVYQKMVRQKIELIQKTNKMPIVVGGTGLYIKSVLHDFNFDGAHRDEAFENRFNTVDNETLYNHLKTIDPEAVSEIHVNNRKRILQALYRAEQDIKISEEKSGNKPLYDYLIIGLTMERALLYERINQRVDEMFKEGLVKEVKDLYKKNINTQSVQAIGYKELYAYFDGDYDLEKAKELIKRNTRRYAKRQYTYFNNQLKVHWFNVNLSQFDQTINEVKKHIDFHLKRP
jgi:tRNA dimethylallyltransferase